MKRTLLLFLAVVFPSLALFLCDNPGGGVVALIMQATAVGWLPASLWAWKTVKQTFPKQSKRYTRNTAK